MVCAYETGGYRQQDIAELFGIARATLVGWLKLKRQKGRLQPREPGGGRVSKVDETLLKQCLDACPDATKKELTWLYNPRVAHKDRVHASSLYRALPRFGYTYKKKWSDRRNKHDPT